MRVSRPGGVFVPAAALFLALQSLQAFSVVVRSVYGEWEGKGGDKITTGLNLLTLGAGLVLLAGAPSWRAGRRAPGNLPVPWHGLGLQAALGALLMASACWSADPSTTLRRAALYGFVILAAAGLAARLTPGAYFRALALAAAGAAALSLLMLVLCRGCALAPGGGELRGVFSHKNMLGQAMAAGVLAALHLAQQRRGRIAALLACLLCTGAAVLSRSTTSLMVIGLYAGAHALLGLWRRGGVARPLALAGAALLPVCVVWMLADPGALLALLGKDPTLTGRTELWAYVEADIAQHPLLGWGFGAFWTPANPAALEISAALRWYVPQAHNGVLEILLQTGLLGLLAVAVLLGRTMVLGARCLAGPDPALGFTTLLLGLSILVLGTTEAVLLDPLQPVTMSLLVVGLLCERALAVQLRARPVSRAGRRLGLAA